MDADFICRYLESSVKVLQQTSSIANDICGVGEAMVRCLKLGGTIFWCGNGGSASDAQHLAAELVGRFQLERPALSSIALNTDTSVMTAIANDYAFEDIFSRQLAGLGKSGDMLIGISTSGASRNVLKALEVANSLEIFSVLLTSDKMKDEHSYISALIKVPSEVTSHIQEAHIAVGQALCGYVESKLYST